MPDLDRSVEGHIAMTVRRAGPDDAAALQTLAIIDSAEPLVGDLIVAEVGGEIWAARSLGDGAVISDPFRRTGQARELLELRARHLAEASRTRSGRSRWPLRHGRLRRA